MVYKAQMANIELEPYRHASSYRRIAAAAWDDPRDPTIYGTSEVRAERLLEWIEKKRAETGERITVTHAVARAVALVLGRHRDLNAVPRRRSIYLRKDVDVFLQVVIPNPEKLGGTDLSGLVIRQADTKDTATIAKEVRASVEKIRTGKDKSFEKNRKQANTLPAWAIHKLLRLIDFLQFTLNVDTGFLGAPRDPFGSAMVTSMGMLGVKVAYAPFFPLARCPMLILVGATEDTPVVEDGAVVVRKVLTLNGTFDHRVIDGYHAAVANKEIKRLLENPALLDLPVDHPAMIGGADATTDLETLELNTQEQPLQEAPVDEAPIDEMPVREE